MEKNTTKSIYDVLINDTTFEEAIVKTSIKNLGVVNVNAIKEYQELKERYDFMSELFLFHQVKHMLETFRSYFSSFLTQLNTEL